MPRTSPTWVICCDTSDRSSDRLYDGRRPWLGRRCGRPVAGRSVDSGQDPPEQNGGVFVIVPPLAHVYPAEPGPALAKRVEQRKIIRQDRELPGDVRLAAYDRKMELLGQGGQASLHDFLPEVRGR